MQTVNVLLIDADQLFREGLKQLLAGSEFGVAAEATDLDAAGMTVEHGIHPDLVLVEFDCKIQDVTALGQWREKYPGMKLVVLATGTPRVGDLARCFGAGADAYLLKTISSEALKQSMALVLLGEKVFPTRMTSMLVQSWARQPAVTSVSLAGMSERENQILRCLLAGQPNKLIGKQLNITEATVKVHLKSVLKKITASNRTQAAILALQNGLSGEKTDVFPPARLSLKETPL